MGDELLGSLDEATAPVKRRTAALLAQLQAEADPSKWPADTTIDATNPPLVKAAAVPGQLDAATAVPPAIVQRQAGAAVAAPPGAQTVGSAEAPGVPGIPSMAEMYMREKMRGATDLEAALRATRAAQQTADIRTSLREAGDMARTGKTDQTAFRAAMMDQAQNPLREFAARQDLGVKTMDEVKRRLELAGADRNNAIAAKVYAEGQDPASARNKFAQSLLPASIPPEVRARVTADMVPQFKDLIDQYAPMLKANTEATKAPAEIAKLGAEAGKTLSETGLAEKAAPGQRAKTAAEAAKIGTEIAAAPGQQAKTAAETRKELAEAGIKEMEVGGQVAPGWTRAGGQKIEPAELVKFRDKVAGIKMATDGVDRLLGMLGPDSDIFKTPEARAKAAPVIKRLLLDLKNTEGVRGLPQGDISFFNDIVPDPNAITPAALLGLAKNRTKLKAFRGILERDLQTTASTLGLKQGGGASAPAQDSGGALPADTVRFKMPDGQIVPVHKSQVDAALRLKGVPVTGGDALARR